jgi:hypothetical protein
VSQLSSRILDVWFCTSQIIFDTNSLSTCSDGFLDAEETKELVKHLQFGAIQHRKSQPSKEFPPIQNGSAHPPPALAFLHSRSHSSIRLQQMKDKRAVEVKTAEDDTEKKYEIITVKAYFV